MTMQIKRLFTFLLPVALAMGLAGCSTQTQTVLPELPTAPFGDYLLARYASSESAVKTAALYYDRALQKDPDNAELRQRVMLAQVFAGNLDQATKLARVILETEANDRLAVLILAADGIAKGNYIESISTIENTKLGPLNQVAGGLLHGWALHGDGRTAAGIDVLTGVSLAPVLGDFALFHQAVMLGQDQQFEVAEIAFEQAMKTGIMTHRIAYAWANMRLKQGNLTGAKELLQLRLDNNKDEIESGYLWQVLQTDQRRKLVFATAQQGAAEALFGPAQAMAERSLYDLAIIYLELALHMDPYHDAAKNLLARLYELQARPVDALAMLAQVQQNQPWYLQSQLDKANALFRDDRPEDGLAHLQALAQTNSHLRVQRALANAWQIEKEYDQAMVIYSQLIEADPEAADWQLYFARAVTLERTGRWPEAVPDFRKSLELNPDNADVLNYLGYTFVDAGENVEEGLALIRKAIALKPRAGYIVDSLGWAYYRLGQYDEAVTELERAVEMEPGEPTINDHLGDAYWQVGRKLEAKFQWQRVLTLEPDGDVDLARINDKIKYGLKPSTDTQLASDLEQ